PVLYLYYGHPPLPSSTFHPQLCPIPYSRVPAKASQGERIVLSLLHDIKCETQAPRDFNDAMQSPQPSLACPRDVEQSFPGFLAATGHRVMQPSAILNPAFLPHRSNKPNTVLKGKRRESFRKTCNRQRRKGRRK